MNKIGYCLATVLIVALIFLGGNLANAGIGTRLPHGERTGEVEFNAIIQLVAPIVHTWTVLFVRYSISTDNLTYGVQWVEPTWEPINFAYYPYGLSLQANSRVFCLESVVSDKTWLHHAPFGERGTFKWGLNNYGIDDQRYAFGSALSNRISVRDLNSGDNKDKESWQVLPKPAFDGSVKARFSNDLLDVQIVNHVGDKSEKEIRYFWNDERFVKEVVLLKEHYIPVGGFKLHFKSNNGDDQIFTQLPSMYHKGGRRCVVLYRPTTIGGRAISLPASITVTNASTGQFLREARLSDFRVLKPDTIRHQELGGIFHSDPFFGDEQKYRRLLYRYWLSDPSKISREDAKWLRGFAADCEGRLLKEERTPYRLKYIHWAITANLMLGQHDKIIFKLQPMYLGVFWQAKLAEAGLLSERDLIQLSIRWKHFNLASQLAQTMGNHVLRECPLSKLVQALEWELACRRFILPIALCSSSSHIPAGCASDRFQIHYLLWKSLIELEKSINSEHDSSGDVSTEQTLMRLLNWNAKTFEQQISRQVELAKKQYKEIAAPTIELQHCFREFDE